MASAKKVLYCGIQLSHTRMQKIPSGWGGGGPENVINVFHRGRYGPPSRVPWVQLLLEGNTYQ